MERRRGGQSGHYFDAEAKTTEVRLAMRLFIYDKTQSWLTASWWFGAALRSLRPGKDVILHVNSWADMVEQLSKLPEKSVTRVEYWGHGLSSAVECNNDLLTYKEVYPLLERVAHVMSGPDALWFWRTCKTFWGVPGFQYASECVRVLGCRVAGFSHKIWWWQSGLRYMGPEDSPEWDHKDGGKWSLPWPWKRGKTVWCLSRGLD